MIQGTTRVLIDQSGNNLAQCNQNSYYAQGSLLTYAPFGAELDCTQSQTEYKFTGKPRDDESGLDHFGARYNASTLGRFLSPDWSAEPETIPYARFTDSSVIEFVHVFG